ncbi:TPA: hypothetical protein ACRRXW_003187 [Morganella morganii]
MFTATFRFAGNQPGPGTEYSAFFINNRLRGRNSHHSIRSKSKRQITGSETKSMRVMDDAPERTGMCLQRLFVLPVISPAPVLSIPLSLLTTDSGAGIHIIPSAAKVKGR